MSATALLTEALLAAVVGGGIATLVRSAPWPAAWLARKPLACPTCMGFHGALVALLLRWTFPGQDLGGALGTLLNVWREALVLYFAAGAGAALIFKKLNPPPLDLP